MRYNATRTLDFHTKTETKKAGKLSIAVLDSNPCNSSSSKWKTVSYLAYPPSEPGPYIPRCQGSEVACDGRRFVFSVRIVITLSLQPYNVNDDNYN